MPAFGGDLQRGLWHLVALMESCHQRSEALTNATAAYNTGSQSTRDLKPFHHKNRAIAFTPMTCLSCLGLSLHLTRPKFDSFLCFNIYVTCFYLDFSNQILRAVTTPCLVTVLLLLRLLRAFCLSLALVYSTLCRHNLLFLFITFCLLSSLVFQHVTSYSDQKD